MTSRVAIPARQQISAPPKTHRFRVLGVDPAVAGATGYGVVEFEGSTAHMLRFGALKLPARASFDSRLRDIHQLIARLVEEFIDAPHAFRPGGPT